MDDQIVWTTATISQKGWRSGKVGAELLTAPAA